VDRRKDFFYHGFSLKRVGSIFSFPFYNNYNFDPSQIKDFHGVHNARLDRAKRRG
jgi:hypothetical protein